MHRIESMLRLAVELANEATAHEYDGDTGVRLERLVFAAFDAAEAYTYYRTACDAESVIQS